MLGPEQQATTLPPQNLRHDLSEIRKGIWRLDVESPFSAVRRFRELQRAYRQTPERPEITVMTIPGFLETEPVRFDVVPNQAAELRAGVSDGPGLRREFVLLNTIRIPHPFGEARVRHSNRNNAMFQELRRAREEEADRLAAAIPYSGDVGETFLEAIAQNEETPHAA